jgi:hypothetical protein
MRNQEKVTNVLRKKRFDGKEVYTKKLREKIRRLITDESQP